MRGQGEQTRGPRGEDMPRCRQNGAYQRSGAVNLRLLSPVTIPRSDLPLPETVKKGNPGLKITGNLADVG